MPAVSLETAPAPRTTEPTGACGERCNHRVMSAAAGDDVGEEHRHGEVHRVGAGDARKALGDAADSSGSTRCPVSGGDGGVFEARQVTLRWRGHKMAFVDLGTRTLPAMNAGDAPRNISDFGAAATTRRRQAAAAAASANATASAVAASAARHVRRLAAAPAAAAAAPAMSPDPQRAAAAFVLSPPSSARTSALAPTPPVVPTPPEDLDA